MSLNDIATPAAREPGPLVTRCRSRTVANVDSSDRIGGTQVNPVLGGVVVERQQDVDVLGDLGDRLGPLGAIVGGERFDGLAATRFNQGATCVGARFCYRSPPFTALAPW